MMLVGLQMMRSSLVMTAAFASDVALVMAALRNWAWARRSLVRNSGVNQP